MQNGDPRVSIILPTFNRVATLKRAVESIAAQSFHDWELIAINDASTDGTRAYLDALAKSDHRVRPVHHEKNNYPDISGTLNEGLRAARGEYAARLDDDDTWSDRDKLKKQVAYLDAHPDCVVVGGGVIVVDEHDQEKFRYLKSENDATIRARALLANPFTHSTVLFRRKLALDVGGYGPFKNAEDWDLWLKMGNRGTFYNFPEYFIRYRLTEESKTFIFKRSQSEEILRTVQLHRHEYPGYGKAYLVARAQQLYSFLPLGAQRRLHRFLSSLKRSLS